MGGGGRRRARECPRGGAAAAAARSAGVEPRAARPLSAGAWTGKATQSSARSPEPEPGRNVTGGRRGRGSTRARGWGSRWAASGTLRGSSRRSPAGSGAAAPPGPPAAGGTWRGAAPRPASTSSPSTVSASARPGARRRRGPGGSRGEGVPERGGGIAASWAGRGGSSLPSPPVSSLAGSSRGRRTDEKWSWGPPRDSPRRRDGAARTVDSVARAGKGEGRCEFSPGGASMNRR